MKRILITIFLLTTITTFAQDDHILWASFQLKKKASEKLSFSLKPIFRYNNDITDYQNFSIDFSGKYKINKSWSVQLLSRSWFIPSQSPRQFLWLDVAHNFNLKKLKIGNRARYHWALDINNRNDADFIRWELKFSLPISKKLTAHFGVEPWLRLDGFGQLQRVRYQPSISWKINKTYALSFTYWKEDSINLNPSFTNNIWLVNLGINI